MSGRWSEPRPRQAHGCPRPRQSGGRCNSRKCPVCGLLWAGDQRIKLRGNLDAVDGRVALVSVTAPGRDNLPHDENGVPDPWAAFCWNKSAPDRWRKLNAAARARTKRRVGTCPQITRSWEYQKRGLLHVHIVFPLRSLRERQALDVYVQALDELRWRHGFGYVDRGRWDPEQKRRVPMILEAGAAAWYLAKYLAPRQGGKLAMTETVKHRDVPRLVVHVSRELMSQTGITMRNLRLKRQIYRAVQASPDIAGLWPLIESQWDWHALQRSDTHDGVAPNPPPH